jgi:hypothetical protein
MSNKACITTIWNNLEDAQKDKDRKEKMHDKSFVIVEIDNHYMVWSKKQLSEFKKNK